jgi:hypothetical protein
VAVFSVGLHTSNQQQSGTGHLGQLRRSDYQQHRDQFTDAGKTILSTQVSLKRVIFTSCASSDGYKRTPKEICSPNSCPSTSKSPRTGMNAKGQMPNAELFFLQPSALNLHPFPHTVPGVPKNYPDAKKLVTEDCIRPVEV